MAIGTVRQVIGTVVDVEFPPGELPEWDGPQSEDPGEAGEHPLHAVLLGLLVVCLLLKLGVRFAVKPGVKPPEVPARG